MTSDERELKHLVDRHLPSPTHMEFVATRDRVLDQLRATPAHLQKARIVASEPPAFLVAHGVSLAAAAALIVLVATVSFQRADWIATVEAADGSSYTLEPNTVLSATDARGLQLTLKDGSRVEMRSASELSLERCGRTASASGSVPATSSSTPPNSATVICPCTRSDMTIAVAGTVFLVKTVADGSRVAVIEGEVRGPRRCDRDAAASRRTGVDESRRSPRVRCGTTSSGAGTPALIWRILDSFTKGMAQTRGTLTPLARQADVAGAQAPGAQAAALEFEEASIRECDPDNLPPSQIGARGGGANSVMVTPGRFYALCVTPATLIRTSHGYRAR